MALKRDRSYVWKSETGERRMDVIDLIRWMQACDADPLDLVRRLVQREGVQAVRGSKQAR